MKRSPPSASRTSRDLPRRSHATHEWTGACPVIAITNNKGNVVASYTYDAWGVCTIVSDNTGIIANVNPFRYRSYYYDQGIGLYYLQSRYYDPQVCRFINGDELEVLLYAFVCKIPINLFVYCNNEPINDIDSMGCFSFRMKISVIAGIAYALSKAQRFIGQRLSIKLLYTFIDGFLVGFCTVYSLFSISKKTLSSVGWGIFSVVVVVEFAIGNIKNPKDLLEAFIDGYGGSQAPSLLSKLIKSPKAEFVINLIEYLSRLFGIKVY